MSARIVLFSDIGERGAEVIGERNAMSTKHTKKPVNLEKEKEALPDSPPSTPEQQQAAVEFAPELQKVERKVVLVLTPEQDNYASYCLLDSYKSYHEAPFSTFYMQAAMAILKVCDDVVVYCDCGINSAAREIMSAADEQDVPVYLRCLQEPRYSDWMSKRNAKAADDQ